MLTPDGCIIHIDALFYDEQTQKIMLAYLPVQQKESIVYTLLQWFLHWSNQVDIKDYEHLHKLFSMFTAYDFSLERMQQFILDYVYKAHAAPEGPFSLSQPHKANVHNINNHSSTNQSIAHHPKHELTKRGEPQNHQQEEKVLAHKEKPSLFSEEQLYKPNPNSHVELNETESEESLLFEYGEAKKTDNTLRAILLSVLLGCLPLAAWIKLYGETPSFANFMLCSGVTIIVLACILFIFFKHKLKRNEQQSASFFIDQDDTDTEEKHSPYRYYEEDKLKIASRLEQLTPVEEQSDGQSAKGDSYNQQAVPSMQKARQLDTVQLNADDRTVHLEQHIGQTILLYRKHQSMEQQYAFNEPEIIIGRSFEGVHINDEYSGVSRLHLQLEYRNGLITAKDLGSRNGSYLNDIQMTPYKNYIMHEQDQIQLVGKEGPIYFIKWS